MKNNPLFTFHPARLIYNETPKGTPMPLHSPETEPPTPKFSGIPIEDTSLIESPEYKPVKYELTPEESLGLRKVQIEITGRIREMQKKGMLNYGSIPYIQALVQKTLTMFVKVPPEVNKTLADKMQGLPEHVFSVDTKTHFVEINIAANHKPFVDIIKKDAVPEDLYGVKDTGTFLDFRVKAIKAMQDCNTREEIRAAGKKIINATKNLKTAMSAENTQDKSNHLFSKRLKDGEPVNVRLYREKDGNMYILILPYKAATPSASATKPAAKDAPTAKIG